MNKFFRLVSMFAIAGVTFAYTSCTDYSEDIDKANTRIDEVNGEVGKLDGRLATVEEQVKNLNTTVSDLQAAQTKSEGAIADLQTALGKLQEKHAADIAQLEKDYAAADAALKSEIETKINTLTTKFEETVTAINGQIGLLQTKVNNIDDTVASIQETIKGLATKEYVDGVFATKDALALANEAIAALNTTLGTVQSQVSTLQEDLVAVKADVTGLNTKLTAALTAIATAQEDASKALTEIDNIKEALKSYALKSELETAVEQLVTADLLASQRLDAAEGRLDGIDEKIAGIATQIAGLIEKDTELGKKIAQLFEEKFNKADFAEAFRTAYEARFSTDFADAFAKAWAEKFQPAFNTAFETAWNEKFQGEFDTALEEVLGIYAEKDVLKNKLAALDGKDEDLQDQITKLDEKLDGKVDDLNTKITNLTNTVTEYYRKVNERIDDVLGIIEGRLTSIAFVPEYYYDGVPAILFETIAYNPLDDEDENEAAVNVIVGKQNSNGANKFEEYTSALTTAKYRLNPRTVGSNCADFSFVGDKADYVATRSAAPAAPVSIVGAPVYDPATGYVTFSVKKNEKLNVTDNTNKNLDIVALKAVLKQGLTDDEAKAEQKPEVYSEYAHVNEIAYSAANLAISDSVKLVKKTAGHEYAKTFDAAKAQNPVYEMPYDSKYFDLKALVATCINTNIHTAGLEAAQDHEKLDLDKYGLTYKFSVAQTDYEILSDETKTNQRTVIECVDVEKGLYKVKAANNAEFNKEAIGRTPIVRVDLMHGNNIVTRAFIKLVITVTKAPDLPVPTPARSIILSCPGTEVGFKVDEERMRSEVYRVLNISHEDFWNTYVLGDSKVTVNGKEYATFTKPELLSGDSVDGTATKKVVWNFTHGEVGKIGNGKTVVGTLVLVNKLASSPLPKHVTFTFTANFTLPAVAIDVTRNEIFWKDNMYQVNVNVPETKDDDAEKCQFDNKMYTANAIGEQAWKKFVVKNVPCNETGKFVIINVKENGKSISYDKSSKGVYLVTDGDVTYIRLNKTDNNVKAALNSANGLQAELKYEITYKSGDVVYPEEGNVVVNFIRPLNLNMPEGLSVKDAVTGGDKVDFNHADLLTDWRGERVLADVEVPTTRNWYEWVKVCGKNNEHNPQWIPETQVIETPAQLEVEYQTITIPTGGVYFSATIQLYDWKMKGYYGGSWVKVNSYTAKGRSAFEAIDNALTIAKSKESGKYFDGVDLNHKYEIENVNEDTTSETIEFQSVKTVNYIPAKYKTIPGYWAYADCTDVPAVNGDYAGQTVGCYEWTLKTAPDTEVVPGQYWKFYGPISEVTLDVKNVKTNLPDEKLPAKASLVQTGTTVTYMNVDSPINSDYKLFIPAKVTYGWGTINATLEIDVKKL